MSIGALLGLGFLGGCLIVAYAGYETSPRKGGALVFVPVPEAYAIAACMYAMSILAMLSLLHTRTNRMMASIGATATYVAIAYLFVKVLGPLR